MAGVQELMTAVEDAYAAYAAARMAHANAKADYERARLLHLTRSQEKSQAGKAAEAESLAIDEKVALLRAEARSEITSTHVKVLLGELVAAQSVQKFQGRADGGDW